MEKGLSTKKTIFHCKDLFGANLLNVLKDFKEKTKINTQIISKNILCDKISKHTNTLIKEKKTKSGDLFIWKVTQNDINEENNIIDGIVPEIFKSLQGIKIAKISVGVAHELILEENNIVYTRGVNMLGQLGVGDTVNRKNLTIIEHLKRKYIQSISCGGGHSLALDKNGNIYSWGASAHFQTGLCTNELILVPTLINIVNNCKAISCGISHSVVLNKDGVVYSFGNNEYGQCGYPVDQKVKKFPTAINSIKNIIITQICCGGSHTLLISKEKNAYSFGLNCMGN